MGVPDEKVIFNLKVSTLDGGDVNLRVVMEYPLMSLLVWTGMPEWVFVIPLLNAP